VCGATDFEVISREMIEKIAAVEGGLEEETTYDGRKLRWSEDARKGLWTMKNAYQRRRVKARVEKRARMMKLDVITLDFARQVIEEETGAPLEIQSASAQSASARPDEAKLVARDEKKNPLISRFDWTEDATQRILRVPAGFMRNKTQERIEDLARERDVKGIDLALVEEGIEIGKRMMAEMIATYSAPGAKPAAATTSESSGPAPSAAPSGNGGGYLNEVRSLNAATASGDQHG
jgi:Proto-chlorophyllide reductase 57 kD subunit